MALPRSLMPSLQELTAFEAAGRHESFTRAADELSLTQGAVSKQIRSLEDTLGVVLFERRSGRVLLTGAGCSFIRSTRKLLQDYATATHSVVASAGSEHSLKLGVLPTFAARWLIPRLPGFLARHPSIIVNVVTEPEPFDLAAKSVDAAIHFGSPNWAQAEAVFLCDESLIAVTSPAYAERLGLGRPEDLVRAALLQQASRPNLWQDWFDAAGTVHPHPLRGPLFDQFAMTTEAAKAGMGMALIPAFLVERELAEGTLSGLPTQPVLPEAGAYYAVVPAGHRRDPAVSALIDWLVEQAAASAASRQSRAGQPSSSSPRA